MIHKTVDVLHEGAACIEETSDVSIEEVRLDVFGKLWNESLGDTLRVPDFEDVHCTQFVGLI